MLLIPSQKNARLALAGIKHELITSSTCLVLSLMIGTTGGVKAAETEAGGSNNQTAINYFKQGTEKMSASDYTGAIISLTQAITVDPKYYKAYGNRGAARINVQDFKGAIEDINIALKCFPNEPKVLALKTQAERGLEGQSNNNNNNEQAMAQERAAAARRALAQAMIGGDFADPSTMIMMQAQRAGLMNGNAGVTRPAVNPLAPRVAPEGSSGGKNNPFTVHNQPEISSASSSNNSPFSQSSNSSAQSSTAASSTSSDSGNDNPFDDKKTAAQNANAAVDNLPLTAKFKAGSTAKVSTARSTAKQYYELGCIKAESKKFSSAIEEFGQAISHDSNFGEAYANRGLSKFHNRDYRGALNDLERADQLIVNNVQIKSFIQSTKHALGN